MKEITVTEKNAGGRLDKMIFRYLDKASQGFVYKMLRKKNITLNDRKAAGSEILQPGDIIRLYLSDETIARFRSGLSVKAGREADSAKRKGSGQTDNKKPENASRVKRSFNLKAMIVYEDENIIAINKPAGLLSQKASSDDTSVNDLLLEYIPKDEMFTPGVVNRLDRNTSGIILAGKNPASQRELSRAIKARDITKIYLALVMGDVSSGELPETDSDSREYIADASGKDTVTEQNDSGREWTFKESYLTKDPKTNTVKISDEQEEGADRIVTGFRKAGGNGSVTLLEVDLVTGRPHQIRAHMAFLSHPVAGDTKYGDAEFNSYFKEKYGVRSQMLHAFRLEFEGMQGILEGLNGLKIEAPAPPLLRKVLEGEGIWQPGAQEA